MEAQEFGRYRLERLIGSGGMGDVYEAVDLERDRVVALKLLPPLFSGNAEFVGRFRRESRVVARLREPHIIPIHDYGDIDGRLFIDMRLVDDGDTIATLLRDEGPLDPARAVHLIGQIAEALDAAHADGLVHRDVKPSNVLVTGRDFVYVMDFGIVHAIGHTASGLTLSGATIGTLDYMAPERFSDRASDRRVDVYSLACLLYECLTARTPFTGDLPALMYAHVHRDPPAPSAVAGGVPDALDDVVATGMAKAPDDRFGTAGDLADAAYRALHGSSDPLRSRRPARGVSADSAPDRAVQPGDAPDPGPLPVPGPPAPGPEGRGVADGRESPASAVTVMTTRPERVPTEEPDVPEPSPSPPVPQTADGATGDAREERPTDPHDGIPPDDDAAADTAAHSDSADTADDTDDTAPVPSWRASGRRPGPLVAVMAVVLVLAAGAVFATLGAAPRTPSPLPAPPVPPAPVQPSVPVSQAVPVIARSVPTEPTPGYAAGTPDGRFVWATHIDPRIVTVLDSATGAQVASIPVPAAPPRYVTFNADGSQAYVSAYTNDDTVNLVAVIDTRTRSVTTTIPVDRRPYAIAVSPDQRTLWVPSHDTAQVDLIDLGSAAITRRVPVAPNPHWVAFDRGRAYVVDHESSLVTVLDASTASEITTIPVGPSPHSLAVSPDGSRIAVAVYDGNAVAMIDPAQDRVTATIPVGDHPQHVTWAPDGKHLYTADVDGGTVTVVDAVTNTVSASVPVGRSPTSVTTLDPPGTSAVVSVLDDARLVFLTTGH